MIKRINQTYDYSICFNGAKIHRNNIDQVIDLVPFSSKKLESKRLSLLILNSPMMKSLIEKNFIIRMSLSLKPWGFENCSPFIVCEGWFLFLNETDIEQYYVLAISSWIFCWLDFKLGTRVRVRSHNLSTIFRQFYQSHQIWKRLKWILRSYIWNWNRGT